LSNRTAADNSIAANLSSELVDRAAAVSTEASLRVAGDASIAANLSSELVDRASADASIAASLSVFAETEINVRSTADFSLATSLSAEYSRANSVEVSLANLLGADVTNEASIRLAADNSIAANLSSEIVRAESAELSIATVLSSEVSYIISNTDLTSIDSFAEVVANLSTEVSRAQSAEASIAYKELYTYNKYVAVNEVPNGTRTTFTLSTPVKYYSESIYMNGLLLSVGDDYSITFAGGMVTGFVMTFTALTGDKLRVYGVYEGSGLYE
jgi:hypothetical protein